MMKQQILLVFSLFLFPLFSYSFTLENLPEEKITSCPGLTVHFIEIQPILCFGELGSILADAQGGAAPYTYSWTGGPPTAELFDVLGGTYEVMVTDSAGCTVVMDYVLPEPPPMTLNPGSLPETAPGASDGVAFVSATGGTGFDPWDYTYNWDTGDTGDTIANLPTGHYEVTVTDLNGCVDSTGVFVDVDTVNCTGLIVDIIETHPILCAGDMGDLMAMASGGTPPYNFWSSNGRMAFRSRRLVLEMKVFWKHRYLAAILPTPITGALDLLILYS